jgi:peptidoglycan/xylan/chitin deacetylase (PgdA/CDA1 family)
MMNGNLKKLKVILAYSLNWLKIDKFLINLLKHYNYNNFIRAINYHDTPIHNKNNFEKHMQFYKKQFSDVNYFELDKFFISKKWEKEKPGIIICFDDGLKTNYDVAAPLLEEYGFTGWFFIPTDFIGCPYKDQREFAKENRIYFSYEDDKTGQIAMSWDEIIDLDRRGHIICCHTKSHYRIKSSASSKILEKEICESKIILENNLKHKVNVFAWVVGKDENDYSAEAASFIYKAGYKYSFMTKSNIIRPDNNPYQLQRTNIDAQMPHYFVSFQLSGIPDIYFYRERIKIIRKTRV